MESTSIDNVGCLISYKYTHDQSGVSRVYGRITAIKRKKITEQVNEKLKKILLLFYLHPNIALILPQYYIIRSIGDCAVSKYKLQMIYFYFGT